MDASPQNGSERPDRAGIYSPAEAGQVLDLSKRRVLQMLNADPPELVGTKDEHGHWWIPVPLVEDLRRVREREQRSKPPKPGAESRDTAGADRELVEVLRDQVEDLRHRLDREQEANRENRRIIAGLTSRIPELTSAEPERPSEAPQSPQSTGPTQHPTGTTGGPHEGTQTSQRQSLWRRIFGG